MISLDHLDNWAGNYGILSLGSRKVHVTIKVGLTLSGFNDNQPRPSIISTLQDRNHGEGPIPARSDSTRSQRPLRERSLCKGPSSLQLSLT
jgi:hypothetical protein